MTNEEGGVDPEEAQYEMLVDRVNTTATAWLGTTLGCAQCHNHKYDPFTQKDYYRMMAFFQNIDYDSKSFGDGTRYFEAAIDLPTRARLFWRAFAFDAANAVTSPSSAVQSFTAIPSQAEGVAQELGVALWPGIKPPGTVGHATMGDNWRVQTLHYLPANVFFRSPDIEMLRIFDLLDRGFGPDAVAEWMNGNGYPTAALWYPPPEKAVIGLKYVYLASRNKVFVNGTWDIVLRLE